METLQFDFDSAARGAMAVAGSSRAAAPVVVGVVSSGNLEVMVEPASPGRGCRIEISTAARGFDDVWQAVLADFVERARPGDVRISINDMGATPAVVSLRLDQAIEEYGGTP